MKLSISSTVCILHRPLGQLWLCRSSLTVLFFLQAHLYRSGERSIGAYLCIHDDCQKLAVAPFPSETTVLDLNSCLLTESTGKHNAWLNKSRSSMLRPPNFFRSHRFAPVDQTVSTICFCCTFPQETSHELIYSLDCPLWQFEKKLGNTLVGRIASS